MKANQKQWDQTFILTPLQWVVDWQMWGSQRSILRWKIHTRGFEAAAFVFLSLPRLTWTIYNPRSVRHHLSGEWTQCGQSVLLTTCVCSRPSPYSSHVHTEWGRLWKSHSSIAMCQFLCVLKLSWNWLLRFYLVDNLVSPLTEIFVGNFFQSVNHFVEQAFANSEWLSLCACLCLSILLCHDIFWSDLSCLWWMQGDGVLFTNFPPICCPHFISHKMHKIFFGNRAPFVANCQHLRLLGWGANIHLCIPKYLLANFTLWIK